MTRTDSAFSPTHPGAILRHDALPAIGLNVKNAAEKLGVSRQALHAIMRERHPASVTPDMAVRLGKLCGNGPRLWLNMQSAYDLWHAERSVDVSGIPTLTAAE